MAEAAAPRRNAGETDTGSFTRLLALTAGVCVAVPVVIATITGSIGIPHNDDWAFLRILFSFDDTGTIQLVGWNEMTLLGHLALAFPVVKVFGHNVAALNVFVALVSGVGLFMLGLIARRFVAPVYALLVVVLVGAFPGFALVTATFMTDNTAFAAQMACVWLGVLAFESKGVDRDTFLTASLLAGLFAFSIREFAILAPIAVVAGYGVANRRDGRSVVRAIVAMVVFLATAYFLYSWRKRLPGDTPHFFSSNFSLNMLPFLSQIFFTFSLGVAPAVVLVLRDRARTLAGLGFVAVGAAALGVFTIQHTDNSPTCCLRGEGSVFTGNLFTDRGALGNQALFGDRSTLFPETVWLLITGAAIVAGACVLAIAWKRIVPFRMGSVGRDPGVTTLAVLGGSSAGAIVFRHALGGPLFDRYVTMLVAVGAIFLLRGLAAPARWRDLGAGLGAAAAAVVLAIVAVGSAASFDSGRWRAGEAAVEAGIAAEDVDAGFEWAGFHYDGVANEPAARRSFPTPPGYMDLFPGAGNCGLVAASPQTGPAFELIEQVPYSHWIGRRTQFLWVYRFEDGCNAAEAL
jgi:hypothetical protein